MLNSTLCQEVRTTPGLFYSLSFFAASDLLVNEVGTIQISWGNTTPPPLSTIPHSYNPNQNRFDQIVWEHFTVDALMAASDRTTLGFAAINGSSILIDDVRLVAVPEPSTLGLFGVAFLVSVAAVKRRLTQLSRRQRRSMKIRLNLIHQYGRALRRPATHESPIYTCLHRLKAK